MLLPVTLLTAALCGLINLWLALRAVRGRFASKVMTGDGGDPDMIARMRAHANFGEYAPFVLILIGAIELARGPSTPLYVVAVIFLIGRILHPLGMGGKTPNPFRAGGILTTWVSLLVLSGWALVIAVQASDEQRAVGDPVETVVPAG